MNPIVKKLGYSENDRLAIIHADDVGMCQATVTAFCELLEKGALTSGSVMSPCSWLPLVGAYCKEHHETDLGVHLTFTSEWENYRWSPVSTSDPESGLVDSAGFFHPTTAEVQGKGVPDFIARETAGQIEKALNAGIDVSHIDMHMGAMLHPNFLPAYLKEGRGRKIPMFAYRMSEEKLRKWNNPRLATAIREITEGLENDGFPVFDNFCQTDLSKPETRMEEIDGFFSSLIPGLTHFITHPAHDTPELRAITPDWEGRVADYRALESEDFTKLLKKHSIHAISYRDLRAALRDEL